MRAVDLTHLTKTTLGRRKLANGEYEKATYRRLVLGNCWFWCEHLRAGVFLSHLYKATDRLEPQNLGAGDLYVSVNGWKDYGVDELSKLVYLEPVPFFDFKPDLYKRIWAEDDATRGADGHVSVAEAYEETFKVPPLVEQKDEADGDSWNEYTREGLVIRVAPDGNEIWQPKLKMTWQAVPVGR